MTPDSEANAFILLHVRGGLVLCTAEPYINIMQVVIETPDYLADVKALSLTDDERRFIVDYIAQTPDTNLSQAERNELKQILGALAETYREGVKRNVKSKK